MVQVPTRPMNELHPELPKFHKSLATQSAKGFNSLHVIYFVCLPFQLQFQLQVR